MPLPYPPPDVNTPSMEALLAGAQKFNITQGDGSSVSWKQAPSVSEMGPPAPSAASTYQQQLANKANPMPQANPPVRSLDGGNLMPQPQPVPSGTTAPAGAEAGLWSTLGPQLLQMGLPLALIASMFAGGKKRGGMGSQLPMALMTLLPMLQQGMGAGGQDPQIAQLLAELQKGSPPNPATPTGGEVAPTTSM